MRKLAATGSLRDDVDPEMFGHALMAVGMLWPLYARAEFKCEGPVFDACMTAFEAAGTMPAALAAIAKAPSFCQ